MTVTINGANDAPTVSDATFSVDENSAANTVVGTVAGSDPDTLDVLNYAITTGNTGAAFQINASSGEITVANSGSLDFETTPVFTLTVEVTDPGGLTDTAQVTINLNDVPENGGPIVLINGELIVTGTADDNDITIINNGDGTVTVTYDGLPPETFDFDDIDSISVDLGDGDDTIVRDRVHCSRGD